MRRLSVMLAAFALAVTTALAFPVASAQECRRCAPPDARALQRVNQATPNQATVNQTGTDLRAAVAQRGAGQSADVVQRGRNLSVGVVQTGSDNTAVVRQRGQGHDATIAQTGDANTACLIQLGQGQSAAITQTGGESVGLLQTPRGSFTMDASECIRFASRPAPRPMARMR